MRAWDGTADGVPRWSTVGSKAIVDSRWLRVRSEDCVTADGTAVADYFVIEHPDWVHVVALDEAGSALLVVQYRHGARIASAEFPAGAVMASDASPLDAARRELREETGYIARQWDSLGVTFANPACQANQIYSFLARDLRYIGGEALDPTELVQGGFFSWGEVFSLHDGGLFVQALHFGTMLLAFRFLGMLAPANLCWSAG